VRVGALFGIVWWVWGHCTPFHAPSLPLYSTNVSLYTTSSTLYINLPPLPCTFTTTTTTSTRRRRLAAAAADRYTNTQGNQENILRSSMKMSSSTKRRLSTRGLGGVLREQRARLYIIRRCVVMLLCWHE
jgi:hypothetical protein